MFIHTNDVNEFSKLKEAGFVPLKEDTSPYILLFDNEIKFNFENTNIEIKDVMYL